MKWVFALFILVGGMLFPPAGKSQVVLWPGQEVQLCNTYAQTTGHGVVCNHEPERSRLVVSFANEMWFRTFWGDGSAGSLYQGACQRMGLRSITEVMRQEQVVRELNCTTYDSTPWKRRR